MPDCLDVTASTQDGVVMAIQHKTLPVAAVPFHAAPILSLEGGAGLKLIRNVLGFLHGAQLSEGLPVTNAK